MFPFISYPGFSSFLLALLFLCKSKFEHYFVYCIVRYSYFTSCINCFFLIQRIQPEHFIFLLDDFPPFFQNILLWSPKAQPYFRNFTSRFVYLMYLPETSWRNAKSLGRRFLRRVSRVIILSLIHISEPTRLGMI